MKLVNIHNRGRKLYLFIRNKENNLQIETVNSFFPYFYTPTPEGNYKGYKGEILKKIIVSKPSEVAKNRAINSYESDIIFTRRYLIDKVETLEKCPIKYCFIDIEVQSTEKPNVQLAEYPVSCISVYNSLTKDIKTFFLPDYKTEFEMIQAFIDYMKIERFDIWLSWFVKFDYTYLFNRYPNFAEELSIIGQARYGDKDGLLYPAGISIVDYLTWFKIITQNRERQYTLDHIAQRHLGTGKQYAKVDFSKLSDVIKKRNRDDVEIMVKLEEKFKLISYFDEIRRLSKVEWEDLIFNSRVIDMLLLQEAKKQNVVLPMRQRDIEKEDFEGAYREAFETGAFFDIGKYDLASAYPNAIIDFCLDPANIIDSHKIFVEDKQTEKTINKYFQENNITPILDKEPSYFKQNPNALLPTVVKKLLTLKVDIKKKLSTLTADTSEYKDTKKMYEAIKSVVNSAYGVMGNRFFRLYDKRVASAITYVVRGILHYIKDKCEKDGYKVIYVDTDSVFIQSSENLTDYLNGLIKEWYQKYNKTNPSIEFEYEGQYEKLLILTKCRYKGILRKTNGDLETEIKGIESKRKDSTEFIKKFQTELIDKIFNKESKDDIVKWIKSKITSIKEVPIEEISFPCKLGRPIENYKNVPIFLRALNNTENFEKKVGDPFYYIYIVPDEKEREITTQIYIDNQLKETLNKNVSRKEIVESYAEQKIDKSRIKVLHKKSEVVDVVAFDSDNYKHIDKNKIDWKRIIDRNIYMKLTTIFEAMKWDIGEVISPISSKPKIEPKKFAEEVSKEIHLSTRQEGRVRVPNSAPNIDIVKQEYDKIQKEKTQKEILNFDLKDLEIRRMDFAETKKYITEHHYSHTLASSMRLSLGFFYKGKLVTNVVYGYPVGRRVIQWLGTLSKDCAELVRLFSSDKLPKNTESYCIAQSFKYIKENMPELKYLISYADPNHGHVGYIYQATNWRYIGVQRRLLPERRIFIDGKETHARTLNIKHGSTSKKKLEEIYGDRIKIMPALKKHVYLMCLGNKKEKREWYKKFPQKPYPKIKGNNNV